MTQPGLVGVSPGMEDGSKDGVKMAAAQEVGEQEETRDKIYHGQKRFLVADQYVFIDLLYFFHHQKKNKQQFLLPRSPEELEDWEGGDNTFWNVIESMDLDYVVTHCQLGCINLFGWTANSWAGEP